MKAAVIHNFGDPPRYEDFPDPVPGENEVLVRVKAVALENVVKMMAQGTHYASRQFLPVLPAIVGLGGIGMLDDGTMIGFVGLKSPYGSMAELAVIPKGHYVPVLDGIDPLLASSLPSSALTALMPLKWIANLQPGETVLVNGATGFAGELSIQVAKLLGAGRVVGTGRDEQALRGLLELGADAVIDLKLPDEQLAEAFTREAGQGYNAILDYLWGHPTDVLLKTLIPRELGFATRRIHLIQIGEKAGPTITLSGEALRTSGLVITGAGSIPHEAIPEASNLVWDWLREGKLHANIEQVPLRDIESAWQYTDLKGKRLVVVP